MIMCTLARDAHTNNPLGERERGQERERERDSRREREKEGEGERKSHAASCAWLLINLIFFK